MSRLSRRSFLAGSAALIGAPALHTPSQAADIDVIIVGAGAAGIAAARRVAAANRRFVLLEESDRIGGRCVTDSKIFGVPYDQGAHWIHNPDNNPLAKLATDSKIFGVPYDQGAHWIHNPDNNPLAKLATGFEIYPAPRAQALRVGARSARDSELENFLAVTLRAHRALVDAGKAKADMPALRALPKDLGEWQATVEFMHGPFGIGKDLKDVSAFDLARVIERDADAFCRQGYGAMLAKLGAGLPVQLSMPVEAIVWGKKLAVDTPKGNMLARAIIVTSSTNVLTSDKIEFIPPLPKRQLDAAAKLSLGSYDHIALELPGNPLGLQRDDMVFEQSAGPRTAALLANVSGSDLHLVEVGGQFGRELSAKGEAAMVDFAGEWLASAFGTNVKRLIKRSHATRWNEQPWVQGGMSAAAPGSADARKILMEPLGGNVWFAGEAVHETQWGTVAGAWESGTRAAEAALRKMGALKAPDEDKPARRRRRRGDE